MLKKTLRSRKKLKVKLRPKIKKQRIRLLGFSFLTVGIIATTIFAVIWLKNKISSFLSSDVFTIKELRVVGLKTISSQQLNLDTIKGNVNIWQLSSELFSDIIKKYPRIKDIKISKHYPDRITLIFSERTPMFLIKENENIFAVDCEGVLFEPVEQELNSLIIVEKHNRSAIEFCAVLNLIKTLKDSRSHLKDEIASIRFEGSSIITRLKDNTEIRWGKLNDKSDIKKTISYLEMVYNDATERFGKIAYIDITDIEENSRAVVLPLNKKKDII